MVEVVVVLVVEVVVELVVDAMLAGATVPTDAESSAPPQDVRATKRARPARERCIVPMTPIVGQSAMLVDWILSGRPFGARNGSPS